MPRPQRKKTIIELIDEVTPIEQAMRRAVRKAIRQRDLLLGRKTRKTASPRKPRSRRKVA